ncbi:unnamed protein product [Merluccius merluccius]
MQGDVGAEGKARDKELITSTHRSVSPSEPQARPVIAMEAAINVLVSQFKTHAGKDGAATTLSKEEFHSLVKSDLPNLVKNSSDPAVIDRLMSSLDENNDGELTFNEFWQLIGTLAGKQAGLTQ